MFAKNANRRERKKIQIKKIREKKKKEETTSNNVLTIVNIVDTI
jgi:hypothetical protein